MTEFGRDVSCTDGLKTGRYATGTRLVAESFYRRLTTPRGMLRGGEEEQNFGLDLTELIGSVANKADAAALPGRIEAELKKDERAEKVSVRVVDTTEGVAKSFVVYVSAETSEGPLELQLDVSEVTVALVGIKEG